MTPKPGKVTFNTANTIGSYRHIVFLGVYNADRFASSIENWLPKMKFGQAALVISDNASTDNTAQFFEGLLTKLKVPSAIIQNEQNYGGYGNLAVNLPLFTSAEWVTTLHQDDSYSPEHLIRHFESISRASVRLGLISSEARSVGEDGKVVAYPRAGWLLSHNEDPVTLFLTNLKHHAFPFSGATFAMQALQDYPIPWHSSAFPDTEIVLKMCAEYEMIFAEGVTVDYLENSSSESHSLNREQRDYGAFQALLRVFGHPNFGKICQEVPKNLEEKFVEGLLEGIEVRFGNSALSDLMSQYALEVVGQNFGVTPKLASKLAKGYKSVSDRRAIEVLAAMGSDSYLSEDIEALYHEGLSWQAAPRAKLAILRVFGLLPFKIRRAIFRKALSFPLIRSKLRGWDFDWKH